VTHLAKAMAGGIVWREKLARNCAYSSDRTGNSMDTTREGCFFCWNTCVEQHCRGRVHSEKLNQVDLGKYEAHSRKSKGDGEDWSRERILLVLATAENDGYGARATRHRSAQPVSGATLLLWFARETTIPALIPRHLT